MTDPNPRNDYAVTPAQMFAAFGIPPCTCPKCVDDGRSRLPEPPPTIYADPAYYRIGPYGE